MNGIRELVSRLKGKKSEDQGKGDAVRHQKVRELYSLLLSPVSCSGIEISCGSMAASHRFKIWCIQVLWDRALEIRIAIQKLVTGVHRFPVVGLRRKLTHLSFHMFSAYTAYTADLWTCKLGTQLKESMISQLQ